MAGEVTYLYERDDFPQLIEAAAAFHRIPNPAIIEKDYYVTEALRLIAQSFGDQVIFKGGTSLSKGWKLIDRFSEDIDLFINPGGRGAKARNTLLKAVAAYVAGHPALTVDESKTERVDGIARATTFYYQSHGEMARISRTVLLEVGVQSGTFPTEKREIRSLLAECLIERGISLETNELESFILPLLHYRRTVIEKLFALHDKVERGMLIEGKPIGGYARHYYDVSQLLALPEVQAMLQSEEIKEIALDYRRVTGLYFPNQLFPPRMNLDQSQALYPAGELRLALAQEYDEQCLTLCYGEYPSFNAVITMLGDVRRYLGLDLD